MHFHNTLRLLPLAVVACGLSWQRPAMADEAGGSKSSAAALFERLDANADGQLTRDEVPEDKRPLFDGLLSKADKDSNGTLSQQEFAAGLADQRAERPLDENPTGRGDGRHMPDPEQLFKRWDRNGDGKVVADEVPEEGRGRFEKLLSRADKNGDGAISLDELRGVLGGQARPGQGKPGQGKFGKGQFGQGKFAQGPAGQREPGKMFDYLDRNADGKLTLDEVPAERRPMFERLIKHGDRDGDGALSREEFTAAIGRWQQRQGIPASANEESNPRSRADMPRRGGNFSPERFARRMQQLDKNHDDKLSREEFEAPAAKRFAKIDANQDGYLDRDEIRQRAEAVQQKIQAGGRGRPGPSENDSP